MTPLFSSTFSALFVTFIFVFKNIPNFFLRGPPFGPFWSIKYLNFGKKLPIQTPIILFKKVDTDVTKSPCYVLISKENQKKVSANGLERRLTFHMNCNILRADIKLYSRTALD